MSERYKKKLKALCGLVEPTLERSQRVLYFMVTILQRSIALNLPLDKQQLSKAGDRVRSEFICQPGTFQRVRLKQIENGTPLNVWHYPDTFSNKIDEIILSIAKPKRKRLSATRVQI